MYRCLCLYICRYASHSDAAFSSFSFYQFKASWNTSKIWPPARLVPVLTWDGAAALHHCCVMLAVPDQSAWLYCSSDVTELIFSMFWCPPCCRRYQTSDSHQVFHLQCDRNKMEGEMGMLFKQEKQPLNRCLLRAWAGPSWEFLWTSGKPVLSLIWLFDYSYQGKPFNSTSLQTGLFLAFSLQCFFQQCLSITCCQSRQF